MGRTIAAAAIVGVLATGCSGSTPKGLSCPSPLEPTHMTDAQLGQLNIASIPRQGATSLQNVKRALVRSRHFIRTNYLDVVEIGIGPGWGVSYSQDQYGNDAFHHSADHMIYAVVGKRSECPDTSRGTLFVFGEGTEDLRVPVRFLYRKAG
jgi:hypothetical protein